MKIYKCIISGDEMFSDTYPMEEKNGFYVVKGKHVMRKGDSVDDALLGGNPSAEDGAEGDALEEGVESGINIVLDSRLVETGFGTKKEYQLYMKDYMKNVMTKLKEKNLSDEELAEAKTGATEAFKEASGKFADLQFYTGESSNADGHIALMRWLDEEEDGKTVNTPYLYFYKAGIVAEKV